VTLCTRKFGKGNHMRSEEEREVKSLREGERKKDREERRKER